MTNCPICQKEHQNSKFICECGYQRLKEYDEKDYLFEIYKFSKAIFNHQINWDNSPFTTIENNNNEIIIKEVLENKYTISKIEISDEKCSKTDVGILPFNLNVKSLIINVDEIDKNLLDESNIRMIFIGNKLKKIKNSNVILYSQVKYIEVDSKNKYFSSENNVLFNKNKSLLLNYARCKNETEYYVPKTVKEINNFAFYYCENLKTIHVSKNVKIAKDAIYPKNTIEIRYDL